MSDRRPRAREVRPVRPYNGPRRPEPAETYIEPPRHELVALEGFVGSIDVWACQACPFTTVDLTAVAGHVVRNQYEVRR